MIPKELAKVCSSEIGCVSPRRRQWRPPPVLLPGKSHGQRSLVGCSPWGREELDTTERLPFHFSLSCIGEGNGNPLQCSCLENPRDGGAWWAAVYGVTQSWTWLKWLSNEELEECSTIFTKFFQKFLFNSVTIHSLLKLTKLFYWKDSYVNSLKLYRGHSQTCYDTSNLLRSLIGG